MTNRFNLIGNWVASQIVQYQDVQQRVSALTLAIDIAVHCLELRNYNTCFAILAGLNSASISRLKIMWDHLAKKIRAQYRRLLDLFEMSNNFISYRSHYAAAALPKVPYLMLFPKDLIAIEDNNPTLLQPKDGSSSGVTSINFQKMRLLWNVFSDIRKTQQAVYPFPPNPSLHVLLTQIKSTSEDELWARSLISEPREQ